LGEQLYWECNTLKASETFPRGLSALVWEKIHTESSKDMQPALRATDDFYRFQNRERRKEAEGALKRKFEEDRRRVESMRERRGRVRPEA